MKVRMMAVLLSVCLLAPASATSLKLSPELDLLVIDGKKMSGAILKGADSLEIDAGQHQILFQVSKTLSPAIMPPLTYRSPAMIVTFSAKDLRSVSLVLPTLNNETDAALFNRKLNYRMVDEHGQDVATRRDVLRSATFSHSADLVKIMIHYNQSGLRASVPDFAALAQKGDLAVDPTALSALIPASQDHNQSLPSFWAQLTASPHFSHFLSWFVLPRA
ncbi:DUF2057 family protein [Hafnia psychrotolerans]|uniref:UPF0319 protein n=1 Tax=Hafnia psychrotolerans TaxID=1477018 RepID=A0ABQ1G560_9GAMM|nr:DUF2057 family protein [Hafnia psychrotolerans]GGA37029.1 UPF0319 protein [Hafnia psychrotolerans]